MKMFKVGGCVRDEIMGVSSKDIDFTVVLEDSDFPDKGTTAYFPTPFEVMERRLTAMGFKVFLSTPEFFTVRAQFPRAGIAGMDSANPDGKAGVRNLTADFVLARKESDYTDGRRPDKVEVGTLLDDLRRRDFTMNAIAKDSDGTLIDPFGGAADIARAVIEAVGDAQERMDEDALRALRALRFSVTKDMAISRAVEIAMESESVLDAIVNKISDERIKDELNKMFAFDTRKSLDALSDFPLLTDAIFSGSVSLEATMKQRKGR